MKKLLFLVLFATAALAVQAQTTKHNCTGAASSASVDVSDEAIAQAASLDETIERRVCETSGKVSYYRKDVCQKSGKVSYEPVNYDAATNQFVTGHCANPRSWAVVDLQPYSELEQNPSSP